MCVCVWGVDLLIRDISAIIFQQTNKTKKADASNIVNGTGVFG